MRGVGMRVVLSVEQAEALRATLRFTTIRLAKVAGSVKAEPQKREWAAERVEHLNAVLTMLDESGETN